MTGTLSLVMFWWSFWYAFIISFLEEREWEPGSAPAGTVAQDHMQLNELHTPGLWCVCKGGNNFPHVATEKNRQKGRTETQSIIRGVWNMVWYTRHWEVTGKRSDRREGCTLLFRSKFKHMHNSDCRGATDGEVPDGDCALLLPIASLPLTFGNPSTKPWLYLLQWSVVPERIKINWQSHEVRQQREWF